MVGHLIAEVAACGDAERDDLCQTPRKVRWPTTPDLPVYVDDRKLLQSAYWCPIGVIGRRERAVIDCLGRRAIAECPVSARAAGQLASPAARGKPALQRFTGWVPLPGLTKPGVYREAGTCP
jgi:hypothetical protein